MDEREDTADLKGPQKRTDAVTEWGNVELGQLDRDSDAAVDTDTATGNEVAVGDTDVEGPRRSKTFCGGYPVSLIFILGNELGERFSYYGMRAVLAIFFTNFFEFSEENSTLAVHVFIFACYFSPVLGGYLSDSIWGKYKTIFRLSIVYCIGCLFLAVSALNWPSPAALHMVVASLGLLLIALGTGGIKPCVSAFGGDQFTADQEDKLVTFFHIFYFFINLGSFVSILLTPIFRQQFGFFVAFAIPAVLLSLATLVFWLGRHQYRNVPPGGSVVVKVAKVIRSAWRNRKSRTAGQHWLDPARVEFDSRTVNETQTLVRVMKIFLPLPMFWALFDQQTSRWTFQAYRMNRFIGTFELPGESMQSINAGFILIMVPVFERLIYPGLQRLGLRLSMLQRIGTGMFLIMVAYIWCAFLQHSIDTNPVDTVNVLWQAPQYWIMTCGEVMTSITGLEFAYAEAPTSMKSVVMALYLLTVAIGNLFVAITSHVDFCGYACDFYMFAGLMLLALLWFIYLARGYARSKKLAEDTYAQLQEFPSGRPSDADM